MFHVVLYSHGAELDFRVVKALSGPDAGVLHPRDLAQACADWLLHDGDVLHIKFVSALAEIC